MGALESTFALCLQPFNNRAPYMFGTESHLCNVSSRLNLKLLGLGVDSIPDTRMDSIIEDDDGPATLTKKKASADCMESMAAAATVSMFLLRIVMMFRTQRELLRCVYILLLELALCQKCCTSKFRDLPEAFSRFPPQPSSWNKMITTPPSPTAGINTSGLRRTCSNSLLSFVYHHHEHFSLRPGIRFY